MYISKCWPQQWHQCAHSGCRLVLGTMKERGSLEGGRDVGLGLWSCPSGAAGLVCAETLRQEGFSDRIVLCTLDRHLPYDRAKLSKVGMGALLGSLFLQVPVTSLSQIGGLANCFLQSLRPVCGAPKEIWVC